MKFQLEKSFPPAGDQPKAIEALVGGLVEGRRAQVLLGITGSGKTYTMANVVAEVDRPTLVLAHNKTLAAQLYQEFKQFFPHNAVEYFVSYYDYYQPEAYIPRTDTYIEKDLAINARIEQMRLSATRSLLERRDVLIVSSVSCIYGLGMPEHYAKMVLTLKVGERHRRDEVLFHLVEMHYTRSDLDFARRTFRARGEILEIFPAYEEKLAFRVEFLDDLIERISTFDPLTGRLFDRTSEMRLYPGSHHVTPHEIRARALSQIREELEERLTLFESQGRWAERERLSQRTRYDIEMIREIGFCKGIENYSRHLCGRAPGAPPSCLLDYFPKDYLLFIDESHQTIPQMHAMYHGDQSRKRALVEYGFRLPSAFDNRPLRFEEAYARFGQVIYVSATPGLWERSEAEEKIVEQIIRPTGLLDPQIEVRSAEGQIDDLLEEIQKTCSKGARVLVTTLTKRLAEEVTSYLHEVGVKAKYLHSEIDTIERIQILRDLRMGIFDVLVGINLLREGLDIPEVALVAVLDADKEGFLRSETSLIQTCGRAARNAEGRVLFYAHKQTEAMKRTLSITEARRTLQEAYNAAHGIVPKTIYRDLGIEIGIPKEILPARKREVVAKPEYLSEKELQAKLREAEHLMKQAAREHRFEEAASYRDLLKKYQTLEVEFGPDAGE